MEDPHTLLLLLLHILLCIVLLLLHVLLCIVLLLLQQPL
jgi:hypothetical protein